MAALLTGEPSTRQSGTTGWIAIVLLLLAAPLACEDEDGPIDCPRMAMPTGGNPIGRWEILDYCVQPKPADLIIPNCPGARLELEGFHALGGTVEIGADGIFRDNSILSEAVRVEVPLGCTQITSCDGLVVPLETVDDPSPYETMQKHAVCRGRDVCTCAVQLTTTYHREYPYRIEGAKYLSVEGEVEFSVVGNELRVQSPGITARLLRK